MTTGAEVRDTLIRPPLCGWIWAERGRREGGLWLL